MAMNYPSRPFGDVISLRDAMNNLLQDSFVRPSNGHSQGPSSPVDIWQTDNELIVRVLAPGVRPDDLSITILNGTLTLKGECKPEPMAAGARVLRHEIVQGSWQRSFELPFSVQVDKAEARFDRGMLTVTLPKAEEAKPRQITINVTSGGAVDSGKASS